MVLLYIFLYSVLSIFLPALCGNLRHLEQWRVLQGREGLSLRMPLLNPLPPPHIPQLWNSAWCAKTGVTARMD